MCTAIHFCKEGFFGRTLDFEDSFGEEVVFTPREFMRMGESKNRYSILGVGVRIENTVMYFDGINEWGLTGAALNFPGYAVYRSEENKKTLIPCGLVLPFVLGFCKNIDEVCNLLKNISITDESLFDMPATPLHWIFADKSRAITLECTGNGLSVMDNPYGVLTNSPDFSYHVTRLSDYMSLRADLPENKLTSLNLTHYSRGMGAIGLPGDFSSASRFTRAIFIKENTLAKENEISKLSTAMQSLSSMSVPRGCVITSENKPAFTLYTCLMDCENLTYYFCSHDNRRVRAVKLRPEDGDIKVYPLYEKEDVLRLN